MARIFYGWAIVAAAFLSHLLSYGVLTVAFGVFFPFMAEALSLSRGVLASTGVTTRLVSAALAPVIGPLVDRRGPRLPMLAGVVSLTAKPIDMITPYPRKTCQPVRARPRTSPSGS